MSGRYAYGFTSGAADLDGHRQAHVPEQAAPFSPPAGVVARAIDPKTGQLATSQCPERVDEVFIEGTEPTVYCEVHGGGLWERLRHTFGFS